MDSDGFLGHLIPNVGVINTQAYYLPANQNNATDRMNLGETPDQIIQWLIANDVESQPELRQYGIAAIINGSPKAAAFTGSSLIEYKNHNVGSYYSVQGNILLGQQVLDSMEARFLKEPGDLACKLMAALQGANMVGADSRCSPNGTSSLFAYLKVAQPSDVTGSPSFKVSVRTSGSSGIEPIDSLQLKFNEVHSCSAAYILEESSKNNFILVYPNPSMETLTIEPNTPDIYNLQIIDIHGKPLISKILEEKTVFNVSDLTAGLYVVMVTNGSVTYKQKLIIE